MKIESGSFNDVVLPRAKKGDFEAANTTVTGGIDPDTWIYGTFHTDGNLNRSHFSDPEVDRLSEDGRKEQDLNKRGEIYMRAEKLIMDRSPWIMISTLWTASPAARWCRAGTWARRQRPVTPSTGKPPTNAPRRHLL